MRHTDHMGFYPRQEDLGSGLMDQVLDRVGQTDFSVFTSRDVKAALSHRTRTIDDFAACLSPAAAPLLEDLAGAAQRETRAHFGTSIQLFTPLYIANYCANLCTYCGFAADNRIHRMRLTPEGIEAELRAIADLGFEEVLILTGESPKFSNTAYIADAVRQAARLFRTVGLEIQPVNTDDYRLLHDAGADAVSVYQETYNPDAYDPLHPGGRKRSFPYRFQSQERALRGGMRSVGFGALLGLDDWHTDALATGLHASLVQQAYPAAEISLSCPRLRPTVADATVNARDVHERQLFQILCAYRLFLPYASITVSTRERAGFRDNVIGVVATKVSAGVSTGVGDHAEGLSSGDEQFEIADGRDLAQVCAAVRARGLEPVMNDHVLV
ncbi:2-iminoacetate synthase ThiH [Raineyella fluvialis]|uniref:2-iminoacetate synthase ThiH n=1 Tax=Raineyella fluvialis TaxID=2662261 RepID=A0A5Q2FBZ5_9ACTN|nr:2-iminoacetate synthase ThiH [Raineyella fluvialis]QGF24580.1 2-iminoacetate synthase ThiH [Raineyella fluvialis]